MQWRHVLEGGPENSLFVDGQEVARLWQRVDDGSWWATLDMHRRFELRRDRACTGYQAGRAGCEVWARRHMQRIQLEVAARPRPHLRWAPAPTSSS